MTEVSGATMQVSRRPKYPDYTDFGGPNTPGEDYLLLVDGRVVGGTYWCSAADIKNGQRWASWGPAGYSLGHPDRETAERVQVREYAFNPDLTDRRIADDERERQARLAQEEAEQQQYAEVLQRKREGDDEPGPAVWVLPTHHFLIAEPADIAAVKAWLDAHDLDDVSGIHEIRVEQRATRRVIVAQRARFSGLSEKTETWAVTCTLDPPDVDCTPRPDLVEMLAEHRPAKFPLIDFGHDWACAKCTREFTSPTAVVPWPCPVYTAAREGRPGGVTSGTTRTPSNQLLQSTPMDAITIACYAQDMIRLGLSPADIAPGDTIMVFEQRVPHRKATVTGVARTWLTAETLEGRVKYRFRLDSQNDGTSRAVPARFYTMDQYAEYQRNLEASEFLHGQGISLSTHSPWAGRQDELANLIREAL